MADDVATADTTKPATADKPLAPLASAKPALDAGAAAGGAPAAAGPAKTEQAAKIADQPRPIPVRDPKHDLLMTLARAVEHLTRNGDGSEHHQDIVSALDAVEPKSDGAPE